MNKLDALVWGVTGITLLALLAWALREKLWMAFLKLTFEAF